MLLQREKSILHSMERKTIPHRQIEYDIFVLMLWEILLSENIHMSCMAVIRTERRIQKCCENDIFMSRISNSRILRILHGKKNLFFIFRVQRNQIQNFSWSLNIGNMENILIKIL